MAALTRLAEAAEKSADISERLGRHGRLTDLLDDLPLEFVFRAVAVRAHLEEAGFVVGAQPSDLRRRKLRSALAYDARREVGGCAWRHVGVRLEEQAERLVEPELFVESECVHGHESGPCLRPESALATASGVVLVLACNPRTRYQRPGFREPPRISGFSMPESIAKPSVGV